MNLSSLSPTDFPTRSPTASSLRDWLNSSLTSIPLPQSVQQNTHTLALDHLTTSSSTEINPSTKPLSQLQTIQLKEPVRYTYGYKGANKTVEYFDHLFPIAKKQNKWRISGSLTATFNTRPTRTQIAEILEQNFKVYERKSGQKEEVLKKIEDVFYYADYSPFNIDISNCISNEKGYHFNFTLSLIFGSASARKTQKVFWTLKLKDLILVQDVLVEHDADMRDKKMDAARNPATGGPYFEEWEQDVCWYDDYLKKFEEPESTETDLPQTPSTSNSSSINDSSSTTSSSSSRKRPRIIVEEEESDEELNNASDDASWTPPYTSSPISPSAKRSRRFGNHTAAPAEEPVLVPSITEAIEKAQMIQDLVPTILKNLEEQGKQMEQLQKEKQTFKSKFEQSQKQIKDLQQENGSLQAEKQALALEVAVAQELLAACTPSPSQEELQTQLNQATTQHRELQQSHQEQAADLEEAKRKLQEFEKIKAAFDKLKSAYSHLDEKHKELEEDKASLNRRLVRKQQDLDDAIQKRREAETNLRDFENWWKQGPNGSTSSTNHSRPRH